MYENLGNCILCVCVLKYVLFKRKVAIEQQCWRTWHDSATRQFIYDNSDKIQLFFSIHIPFLKMKNGYKNLSSSYCGFNEHFSQTSKSRHSSKNDAKGSNDASILADLMLIYFGFASRLWIRSIAFKID